MGPGCGLLTINDTRTRLAGDFGVIVQLATDRIRMVMILAVVGLMSRAQVEGLGFPEVGVAQPDAIALPAERRLRESDRDPGEKNENSHD